METTKEILEILSLISGPVIAVFAFFGLRQIKEARNQVIEAKQTRITSAKRDSFRVAADKCTYYFETIIPLIDAIDKEIDSNGIKYFEKSKVTIENNTIKVDPFYEASDFEKIKKMSFVKILNPLEGFSLFFTSGVADESIGFLTVGQTYCGSVKKLLPILAPLAGDKYFKNTLQLFLMWHSRLEKEKLETERQRIDKQLSKTMTVSVKPIGTE